ncbi:MAG: chemotaxis response regulator protein-glutamate methylesterase [Candidatus Eremiobacteraeota bacterium]|nr:chemotaxis response regulator protein-glutamate methylesterase [Candidatus Eremiobacteraeota bacterium]
MEYINVLVVDDTAFIRRAITKILENEPDFRVVATARSGEEAIDKVAQFNPDVVTMDVEMPGIGGLEAVRQIVAHRRVPIIMVSSLTREGAETTFVALEHGAVDFIAKPDAAYTNINEVARDLVAKIRTFARRGARPLAAHDALERATERAADRAAQRQAAAIVRPPVRHPHPPSHRAYECVAIGTSTGGPVALAHVIPQLPADFPLPILVVQHMPIGFTRPLADRLNAQSKLRVQEAANGMILERGTALVVPSGRQLNLRRSLGEIEVHLVNDDGTSIHVPSVDVMDEQVAEVYGPLGVGVILTGMGQDGVRGLRKLKARGGYVIGQDEATCVVYGMPRAAAVAGLVDRVAPLDEIPHVLTELTNVLNS